MVLIEEKLNVKSTNVKSINVKNAQKNDKKGEEKDVLENVINAFS